MILNPDMEEKDYREANMYLAEDRILSLGIYCQTKEKYYLKYVPDAIAKTDPMKDHENLMKQRRRWINSSLFAFLYVWKNYYFNSMESKHGFVDKYIKLNLSMILALLSFVTSYLIPSIYFYVLYETIAQINPQSSSCQILAKVVSIIYIMVYLVAVAGGLTGAVWTKHAHVVSGVLSVFTFAMWGLVCYNILAIYLGLNSTGIDWTSFNQVSILVMVGVNLGMFNIVVFMHLFTHPGFVWKLIKDQISYLTYQGAYAQTMVAHAFCNVDDVSWGTKGASHGGGKKYETEKVFFVSSWYPFGYLGYSTTVYWPT
jgi:cellulose synthase/poly-beta-1,6-N-acetylglucosamine synthase-like glycosyltransferase